MLLRKRWFCLGATSARIAPSSALIVLMNSKVLVMEHFLKTDDCSTVPKGQTNHMFFITTEAKLPFFLCATLLSLLSAVHRSCMRCHGSFHILGFTCEIYFSLKWPYFWKAVLWSGVLHGADTVKTGIGTGTVCMSAAVCGRPLIINAHTCNIASGWQGL